MKHRKLWLCMSILLLLAGLLILLYPRIDRAAADHQSRKIISEYSGYLEKAVPSKVENKEESLTPRQFEALWDACQDYNRTLTDTNQQSFNADSIRLPPFDLSEYGWEQEIFAVLTIPSIQAELPLFLGSNEKTLRLGGTILGQTSLPVGGLSSNCVICGHRTWHGDDQLRHIDEVQLGDLVYIQNPWEQLEYLVTDIQIILPTDSDKLRIQLGRDLLSIFTCTPLYQTSHRYLLICERI